MRRGPWINLALLVLTVATTLLAGGAAAPLNATLGQIARAGLPYCASLLGILFVHEMGHYVVARLHRVDATLPFFIPLPFGPVGTLGAFIRIRSAIPSRSAVLDIGAAGPLAGFVVALPLLVWSFATGEVVPGILDGRVGSVWQSPWTLVTAIARGAPLLEQSSGLPIMGDSLITWLVVRLAHGPLPAGADVQIGAVGFAAWLGMFVTTLNLVPLGQLDGGHVVYALFGRNAEAVSRAVSWVLLAMGIFASWTWLVWWALTRFAVGLRHPPALVEEPITPARRAIAIASLVVFVLTFVPVPFSV